MEANYHFKISSQSFPINIMWSKLEIAPSLETLGFYKAKELLNVRT